MLDSKSAHQITQESAETRKTLVASSEVIDLG